MQCHVLLLHVLLYRTVPLECGSYCASRGRVIFSAEITTREGVVLSRPKVLKKGRKEGGREGVAHGERKLQEGGEGREQIDFTA